MRTTGQITIKASSSSSSAVLLVIFTFLCLFTLSSCSTDSVIVGDEDKNNHNLVKEESEQIPSHNEDYYQYSNYEYGDYDSHRNNNNNNNSFETLTSLLAHLPVPMTVKHLDHEKELSYGGEFDPFDEFSNNGLDDDYEYEALPEAEMWISASDNKEERLFGQTVNFGTQGTINYTRVIVQDIEMRALPCRFSVSCTSSLTNKPFG